MTNPDPCVSLLRELVAINSVNPSLVAGAPGETDIGDCVAQYMRRCGLDVELQEVEPGRRNVIGVLEGARPGPSLMYCGHLDTVGVEGMDAPFTPSVREGRLYGRGAQDMKGGLAAMIDAARLAARRGLPRGRLILAAVVDEEYASLGADALVTAWTADAAVVTEPTGLDIGVAHKGFAWLDVETFGRAAHGSRPHDGRDAILRMGRVLQRLEQLDRELQSRPADPLLGTGSLHASIIAGGQELSSYPDRCLLRMERRTVSGESGAAAVGEVAAILESLAREDEEFRGTARLTFSRASYQIPPGHPLPGMLAAAVAALGGRAEQVGMSFWTDAAVLGAARIPAVLFGPGGAGLHGREEFVNVADVITCRDALASLAITTS